MERQIEQVVAPGAAVGERPTVLLVEDNRHLRIITRAMLHRNFVVEEAENGYQAIERLAGRSYDAVLMDISLGEGPDGIAVLHALRQTALNADTYVIACTALTKLGPPDYFLSEGFDDFVAKPYTKEDLIARLTERVRRA